MSEAQEKPSRRVPRVAWIAMAAGAVVLLSVVGFILLRRRAPPEDPAAPLHAPAFTGDSARLERTVIVPTLDTPMPSGKNVIWCSSFQVAWNRLKDDVIKEPIKVRNAQAIADRLNKAPQSEADLDPESFYAAAGRAEKAIPRIQREMAAKFPTVKQPAFSAGVALVAYAYLQAQVTFTIPYFEGKRPLPFGDPGGYRIPVTCFGIDYMDRGHVDLRKQIEVLYSEDAASDSHVPGEQANFALDLCRSSQPNQLILARISPEASLGETLSSHEKKLAAAAAKGRDGQFGLEEILRVPNIGFDLTHHFGELEGTDKTLSNLGFQGLYISRAFQTVRFKLDRCGAELASEAMIEAKSAVPRCFAFDRPFLIVMRKRGAQHPFFVMWVDNAELLCKP